MSSAFCGRCGRVLEFSGERPLFCAYCGQPLSTGGLDATIEHASDPDSNRVGRSGLSMPVEEPMPEQIAGYRIVRRIGDGGMGSVFEAEDDSHGRKVAVKVLSSRFEIGDDSIERFRQEGRLASTIAHPRCVFVLAADESLGRPYIVMELMTGSTLQSLVEQTRGPLDVVSAVSKILDVIDGLLEAHRRGVIHRDVKPSNCFLEADGRVKVGDFGLSKSLAKDSHLTRTGAFIGTPLYASPEQIKGEGVDVRTDVYSVAATLYFLLTGRPPFEAPDAAATLARIVSEAPVPPRELEPGIPADLEAAILHGMERDRDRRFADLEEFREELLPFAPAPMPAAEINLRVGAFLIDLLLLLIANALLDLGLIALSRAKPDWPWVWRDAFVDWVAPVLLWCLYFGPAEGVYGRGVGKRLMRLRVQAKGSNRAPGVLRSTLRALTLFTILLFPALLSLGWLDRLLSGLGPQMMIGTSVLAGIVLLAAGCLATLSTMSESNGFRGPHELASGTRVVSLPRRQRRPEALERRMLGRDRGAARPVGVLKQVGPYKVRGAVRWDTDRRVLSAQDSVLGREVWVVLKPRDSEPPSATRRHLVRPHRPRWISGGSQSEGRWDAYVAPSGCSLADLAGPDGLPWEEVRPLLHDLATELAESCKDGTLPPGLHPDQVWVEPDGRLQLVDPLGEITQAGASAEAGTPDLRALRLFGSTAALALEGGRRRLGDSRTPVRAAIPRHARQVLDRLFGLGSPMDTAGELRSLLDAQSEMPTRLNPVTRAFRSIGYIASVPVRLAIAHLAIVGLGGMGWLDGVPPTLLGLPSRSVLLLASTIVWVLLAGLTRGRALGKLLGAYLVNEEGRVPSAWRSMLRELAIWLPFALLFLASSFVLANLPTAWVGTSIVWVIRILPLGWILVDAGWELMDPGRTLHDRLCGTRLVPR